MSRTKSFPADNLTAFELGADGEDTLLLIDDAGFVGAFAEAGLAVGKKLVCVRCFDPGRALRAVVVLLDAWNAEDESAGSVGFCCDCYRGLAELWFHDAVLRASRSTSR